MSVSPSAAIATVRRDLERFVLPALTDSHAVSTLKAALGILRNLQGQVRDDDEWCRSVVVPSLEAAQSWSHSIRPITPDIADSVDDEVELARSLVDTEPAAARRALLDAAATTVRMVWREPALRDDPALLDQVRAVIANDVRAQNARIT